MTKGLIPRGCHIDYTVTYQRQPRADPIDNKTDPIDDKHYGRVCWKNFSFVYIFFFPFEKYSKPKPPFYEYSTGLFRSVSSYDCRFNRLCFCSCPFAPIARAENGNSNFSSTILCREVTRGDL